MAVSPSPLVIHERVRWADVDLVGIMRFSAFTRLVENAEQELWRDAGLPYSQQFVRPETWLPRRSLHIEYTAPATIDAPLACVTYVSRLGETAMTFNVDVMSPDFTQLYASATVVAVCVGAADFRKQPLPPELREYMQPYTMSSEAARAAVRASRDAGQPTLMR
jgi:YbgC/YbaW family acyl-CoA thioester hydrolase